MTERQVPKHGSGGIVVPPASYPITLTEEQCKDILDEMAWAGQKEAEKRDKRIAELEAAVLVAATRFAHLAAADDTIRNGVRPSAGRDDCMAVLQKSST